MKIKDLEMSTGLERATIRYYEKEGLISPVRLENGYREYDEGDTQTLLKIKCLRQLGIPLEQIRQIQQGRRDLPAALDEQMAILGAKINQSTRAMEVCRELRAAGTEYSGLEPRQVLDRLDGAALPPPQFRERRIRPVHPWKRFFGRMMDNIWITCLIQLIIVVILRVRPVSDFLELMISCGALFLAVPVNAALLHYLGTTPGKWILGIRLAYYGGGKLSFSDALSREWRVLKEGMGFGIPIWRFWRMYASRKEYMYDGEAPWDEANDVIHEWHYGWQPKAGKAVLIAGVTVLTGLIALDSLMPRYRGQDVTLAQYAENYNFYSEILAESRLTAMNSDGSFGDETPEYENSVVIQIDDGALNKTPYQYKTDENGALRSISFDQTWTDWFYGSYNAGGSGYFALTALGSQDGATMFDLMALADQLDRQGRNSSGTIRYENIEVTWRIEGNNILSDGNGGYYSLEEDCIFHCTFKVTIHPVD